MIDEPLFMQNEEWYYYDFDEKKYKLRDGVPKEVEESYEQFYLDLNEINNIPND